MTKRKLVDLNEFYNFIFDNFFTQDGGDGSWRRWQRHGSAALGSGLELAVVGAARPGASGSGGGDLGQRVGGDLGRRHRHLLLTAAADEEEEATGQIRRRRFSSRPDPAAAGLVLPESDGSRRAAAPPPSPPHLRRR
uniref:Uncharacterized protein n=1 Tax=Oryza sativa subsp. japonica TaxID=39947 RepID=Q6ZDB3_ORYSJ|nr:hypothetical protein [Oryza sativa Japonica Group]